MKPSRRSRSANLLEDPEVHHHCVLMYSAPRPIQRIGETIAQYDTKGHLLVIGSRVIVWKFVIHLLLYSRYVAVSARILTQEIKHDLHGFLHWHLPRMRQMGEPHSIQ